MEWETAEQESETAEQESETAEQESETERTLHSAPSDADSNDEGGEAEEMGEKEHCEGADQVRESMESERLAAPRQPNSSSSLHYPDTARTPHLGNRDVNFGSKVFAYFTEGATDGSFSDSFSDSFRDSFMEDRSSATRQ